MFWRRYAAIIFSILQVCFFNNLYAYFGYLDGQDVITHDLRANFLSLEMKEAIVDVLH